MRGAAAARPVAVVVEDHHASGHNLVIQTLETDLDGRIEHGVDRQDRDRPDGGRGAGQRGREPPGHDRHAGGIDAEPAHGLPGIVGRRGPVPRGDAALRPVLRAGSGKPLEGIEQPHPAVGRAGGASHECRRPAPPHAALDDGAADAPLLGAPGQPPQIGEPRGRDHGESSRAPGRVKAVEARDRMSRIEQPAEPQPVAARPAEAVAQGLAPRRIRAGGHASDSMMAGWEMRLLGGVRSGTRASPRRANA